jgi:predicted transcriptional regulator of viral defense system
MKRINLTEEEVNALETAIIDHGGVVTFDQLSKLFKEDRKYTRIRIAKMTEQGWLKRIKKGVYAISDLGSRGRLSISHIAIVNIIVEEAYISFENALQHHGLYDQLLTNVNSVALKQYKSTTIDAILYNFIKTQQQYFYGWESYDIDGQTVKIADSEKALIDLIQFHRTRYSTDLVLEKLSAPAGDIRQQRLVEYTLRANLTSRRILGFLMDCTDMETDQIHASVADGQSVSHISGSENKSYNHKWRLYYDRYFDRYIHE